MKKIFLIFLSIFFAKLNFAQGPAFLWVKAIQGSGYSVGVSITTDALGNVYTLGYFGGNVDFDPGPNTFTLASLTFNNDIFISKLNANGDFVWAKSFGSILNDYGNSIAVDASGNVYCTGLFNGTGDFDPGPGSYSLSSNGAQDAFVLKLDASGNFVWSKSFGGINNEDGSGITLDASDNIYITGFFESIVDFDPGAGTFSINSSGSSDVFVSKLDNSGNFIWAKNFGGIGADYANAICLDALNNVYTTGYFSGTADFDPDIGISILVSVGPGDVFISKIDASGNYVWAKSQGGTSSYDIEVDNSGNVYTTGGYYNGADFDPGIGTVTLSSNGQSDIYISKLSNVGELVWVRVFGDIKDDEGSSLCIDAQGNILTIGGYQGTVDFDPSPTVFNLIGSMNYNSIFISKLNSLGNYVWAGSIKGSNNERGRALTVDINNNIFTCGDYTGTADFDPDAGIYNLTGGGCFILKMAPCCAGFEEYDQNKKFISVYPNLNRGEFSIDVPLEEKNVRVVLYNLMGQIVFTQSLNAGINTIQTKLDKGLYLARLQGDTFTSEAAKVIVE